MDRYCAVCETGTVKRHHMAKLCRPCLASWGKRTGASQANAKVAAAVRRGDLPPAKDCKCVDCGGAARDYDHRDYNKPLEVQPVCRSCNKLRGPALPLLALAQPEARAAA